MVVVPTMAMAVRRMSVGVAVVSIVCVAMVVIMVMVVTVVVVVCVLLAHGQLQNSLATGNTTPANTEVVPRLAWRARAMPMSNVSRLLGL